MSVAPKDEQYATTGRRGLDDDQGAVMVLGLFFALAVLAALFCLVGIGDAIIARDVSQEATDSAAFTNAVMHARGMNTISFVNMLLLAFVMVYLTLSWLDTIVSMVLVLIGVDGGLNWCGFREAAADALGAPIPFCRISSALEKVSKNLLKFDRKVFDRFEKIAPPLFETQVWIAQLTPWLGTISAERIALEYDRHALSFSTSNFPGGGALRPLDKVFVLDKIRWLNTRQPGVPGRGNYYPTTPHPVTGQPVPFDPSTYKPDNNWAQDRRIGLPVEAEGAFQLCIRGTRFALEEVKEIMAGLSGPVMRKLVNREPMSFALFTAFQSAGEVNRLLFCNEKDEAMPDEWKTAAFMRKVFEGDPVAVQALATGLLKTSNLGLRWLFYAGLGQLIPPDINDKFYLNSNYFWRMNWPDPMQRRGDRYYNGYLAGPKRVAGYAYNGNDWMQIWALSRTTTKLDTFAARVVATPAELFGVKPKVPGGDDSSWFLSQAEFYFDCRGDWMSALCNRAYYATYQIQWKARLRRVHDPTYFADLVELLVDNLWLGPAFTNKLKDKTKIITDIPLVRETSVKVLRNYLIRITNNLLNEHLREDESSDVYLH